MNFLDILCIAFHRHEQFSCYKSKDLLPIMEDDYKITFSSEVIKLC